MKFRVAILEEAREDLARLYESVFMREPERDGDPGLAEPAIGTIHGALSMLEHHPYTCRKSGESPYWRELLISLGRTGFVAQFEIAAEDLVLVGAIRLQREDDYH